MGGRNFPLTDEEVIRALLLLGFEFKETKGGHHQYAGYGRGRYCKITVDKHLAPFSQDLITSMARQANLTKKELYQACCGNKPADWYNESK